MDRRITSLAAAVLLVTGTAVAPNASANGSVAVSIGLPGLAIGFNNHGGGFVAAAPFVYPAPLYAAPPVVAPVVYPAYYWPRVGRPYYWRAPYRVGYYGYRHY
jgi:hypothetical protein